MYALQRGDLPCDPGVCCCAGSRADSARGLLGLDSKPLSLSLSLPRSVGSFLQRAVRAASRDTIESRLTVNFLQATRVMVPALSGTPGEHQTLSRSQSVTSARHSGSCQQVCLCTVPRATTALGQSQTPTDEPISCSAPPAGRSGPPDWRGSGAPPPRGRRRADT